MVRCEAKDVNVDIAGDCDGMFWGYFVSIVSDSCLELIGEEVSGSSGVGGRG